MVKTAPGQLLSLSSQAVSGIVRRAMA